MSIPKNLHAATVVFGVVAGSCGCLLGGENDTLNAEQRTGQLLEDVLPTLERTVELVDRHDSLPKSSINPFDSDQRSNQANMNDLLDKAIDALEVSRITELRDEIRSTQSDRRNTSRSIAEYRRKRIAAPSDAQLSRLQKVNPLVTSREDYDQLIKDAVTSNQDRDDLLEELKAEFAQELKNIGLAIDDEGVESLMGTVSGDDFVSMVTVFENIKQITHQLQTLTDESDESIDIAKRYYGMYVVLVQTMERLQSNFIDEIEKNHIPKLRDYSQQAKRNIEEARELIKTGGGNEVVLRTNIESNRATQKAAEIYVTHLREHARLIAREHTQTKINLATAQNTYKTVRLSGEVATLMRNGRRDFDTLMRLKLPTLRNFSNQTIKREFDRMTEELRTNN